MLSSVSSNLMLVVPLNTSPLERDDAVRRFELILVISRVLTNRLVSSRHFSYRCYPVSNVAQSNNNATNSWGQTVDNLSSLNLYSSVPNPIEAIVGVYL